MAEQDVSQSWPLLSLFISEMKTTSCLLQRRSLSPKHCVLHCLVSPVTGDSVFNKCGDGEFNWRDSWAPTCPTKMQKHDRQRMEKLRLDRGRTSEFAPCTECCYLSIHLYIESTIAVQLLYYCLSLNFKIVNTCISHSCVEEVFGDYFLCLYFLPCSKPTCLHH